MSNIAYAKISCQKTDLWNLSVSPSSSTNWGFKQVFSAMLSGTDKETKESEIQFSSLSRLEMEIVYN